jgi:hypothetical protein
MIKMNKKNIVLLVALGLFLIMLVVFVIAFVHSWPYVFGIENYKIYANVTATNNTFAWEILKDGKDLTFGKIRVPGGASRSMIVNNSYSFPVRVVIKSDGELGQRLSYEKEFILSSGEGREIEVSVWLPENSSLGYYDGFVKVRVLPAL